MTSTHTSLFQEEGWAKKIDKNQKIKSFYKSYVYVPTNQNKLPFRALVQLENCIYPKPR